MGTSENTADAKISAGFRTRLARLGPDQKVRALVVLRTGQGGRASAVRQSGPERAAAVEAMRKQAEQSLEEVDAILEQFKGTRLRAEPDALGTVPVETTAEGIEGLAASERVQAVLEDQAVSLPGKPTP